MNAVECPEQADAAGDGKQGQELDTESQVM